MLPAGLPCGMPAVSVPLLHQEEPQKVAAKIRNILSSCIVFCFCWPRIQEVLGQVVLVWCLSSSSQTGSGATRSEAWSSWGLSMRLPPSSCRLRASPGGFSMWESLTFPTAWRPQGSQTSSMMAQSSRCVPANQTQVVTPFVPDIL